MASVCVYQMIWLTIRQLAFLFTVDKFLLPLLVDSYSINLFEGLCLNPTDFMITKKLENNYI